jgi:hypothetical protein
LRRKSGLAWPGFGVIAPCLPLGAQSGRQGGSKGNFVTRSFPARSLLVMIFLTLSSNVLADCYDFFGCSDRNYFRASDLMDGPNCDFLFMMRGSIYKQRGYCFATPRAIQTFGNKDCQFDNVNEVMLNRFERANVATIQSVEKAKHCLR